MTSPDLGAQGGAPAAQGGGQDGGTGSSAENQGNDGTQTGQSAGTGTDGTQGQTVTATVSADEYERIKAQRTAADQRAGKAEAELKQLRDKDLPALEKAQRDLVEVTAERDQLKIDLKQARLDNAFMGDNTYKWQNPKNALKLADLSNVEIDDDGTVRNLKGALDALAKSDPYLLAPTETGGGDDNGKDKDKKGGSTGALGTGQQQPPKPDAKGMAARLPALRSRGIGGSN